MSNPKTTFEFDGDIKKVLAKLDELDAEIKKTGKGGKGAGSEIASGFEGAVAGIAKVTAALGTAYAALSTAGKALNTAAEFEQLQSRLENMYGSVEKGAKAFQYFQEIAATTPYSLQGVVEAGASLKAFGVDAEKMIKPVADLAAFMGIDIVEAAQAFGRAMAGGAGAADILRERGILQLVKSFKGIDDLTKLSLPQFRQALIDTIQNPTAGIVGATDKLSKTFKGAYSNMLDAVDQLANAMGKKMLPAATKIMQSISQMASGLLPKESDELRKNKVEFDALARILTDVNALQDTRNRAIAELQSKYGSYLGNIDLEKASYDDLKSAIDSANLAFEQKIKLQAAEEMLSAQAEKQVAAQKRLFDLTLEYNRRIAENDWWNKINVGPGKNIAVDMRQALDQAIDGAKKKVQELGDEYAKMRATLLGNSPEISIDIIGKRPPDAAANAGKKDAEAYLREWRGTMPAMKESLGPMWDEFVKWYAKLEEAHDKLDNKIKFIGEQTAPETARELQKDAEETAENLRGLQSQLENIVGSLTRAGVAGQNMGDALKKVLEDLIAKALTMAAVFGLMQLIPGGAALTGGLGGFMSKGFGLGTLFGGKSMQAEGGAVGGGASTMQATKVVVNVTGALEGQKFLTNTQIPNQARLAGRSF